MAPCSGWDATTRVCRHGHFGWPIGVCVGDETASAPPCAREDLQFDEVRLAVTSIGWPKKRNQEPKS